MTSIDLYVDLGELSRVQEELSTLISALVDLGGRNALGADAESMGSRDVAAAVGRFVTNWQDGRERILENLQACQRFAATAVAQYTQTENALTSGLQGGTAPGTAGGTQSGGSGW